MPFILYFVFFKKSNHLKLNQWARDDIIILKIYKRNHFDQEKKWRIMHWVRKPQRYIFSFKIKEARLCHFSMENTEISILRFIWDAEVHQGLELRLKRFHNTWGWRELKVCVLYEKWYTIQKSANTQKFNLPSTFKMYSTITKK